MRIQRIRFVVSSYVFAWLMHRTITGSRNCRVVSCMTFVVRRCVRFISLTASMNLAESFLTPECERHQPCHVERCNPGGDESDHPQNLAPAKNAGRESLPQDFVFREKASEWDDAADRKPPH